MTNEQKYQYRGYQYRSVMDQMADEIRTLRERLAAAEAQLQKFKLSSRLGRKFIYQLGGAFGLSQGIMQARTDALLQIDKLEAEGTEPQPQAETAEER